MHKPFSLIYVIFLAFLALSLFFLFAFFASFAGRAFLEAFYIKIGALFIAYVCFMLGVFVSLIVSRDVLRNFFFSSAVVLAVLSLVLFVEFTKASMNSGLTFIMLSAGLFFNFYVFNFILRPAIAYYKKQKTSKETYAKRREYQRYIDTLQVKCRCKSHNIDCVSYDISGSGIRLILSKFVPEQEELDLEIYLENDSRPVYAKGLVVWAAKVGLNKKESFYAGVKFTKIDSADKIRLLWKHIYKSLKA